MILSLLMSFVSLSLDIMAILGVVSFDIVFSSEEIDVVHTPFQAVKANAFAKRWVGSVREECLDQILILNENHLKRVLKEDGKYYNQSRPHQGIGQRFPMFVPR